MREIEKQLSDILRFHRDHALAAAIDSTRPSSPSQQTLTNPSSPSPPPYTGARARHVRNVCFYFVEEYKRPPKVPPQLHRRREAPNASPPCSMPPVPSYTGQTLQPPAAVLLSLGPVGAAIFQVRAVPSRASDSGFPA